MSPLFHVLPALVAGILSFRCCADSPRRALRVALGVLLIGIPLQTGLLLRPGPLANTLAWPDLALAAEQWLALATALAAAAMCVPRERVVRLRVAILGSILVSVAALGITRPGPALAQPLRLDAAAPGRPYAVVRQTAPSSCSAAAAATLLRITGVKPDATEAELALLCRTDPKRGTSDLGLYRGLQLAAPGRRVEFGRPDLAGLRARAPCIVYVGLTDRVGDPALFAELRDRCNWEPEQIHAVVLFGFEPGLALIGDPRFGFEYWSLHHFEALWLGSTIEVR